MTSYPGHDTEFYAVLNDVVTGPVTGLVNLAAYNITPYTPVWYDGLDDWKPAMLAPLTSQLFDPNSEYHRYLKQAGEAQIPEGNVVEEPPQIPFRENIRQAPEPPVEPQRENSNVYAPIGDTGEVVQKPPTYMIWSIVVAVVFNLFCGIIAIIYSWKVSSKFRRGNIKSANKCSELAQWWIAISICVGLIMVFFRVAVGNFPGF